MKTIDGLTKQEQVIFEAIKAGRDVQDFLWGKESLSQKPYHINQEEWVSVFAKRVNKTAEINFGHPSAVVELRKRVLQQAALSVQALEVIDNYITFPNLLQHQQHSEQ